LLHPAARRAEATTQAPRENWRQVQNEPAEFPFLLRVKPVGKCGKDEGSLFMN
jgi:hypothetical protein